MADPKQPITDRRHGDAPEGVEELIWEAIDGLSSEQALAELSGVLDSDANAVRLYVDCCQLHAAMIEQMCSQPQRNTPPPVLGSLGDVYDGIDDRPPVT